MSDEQQYVVHEGRRWPIPIHRTPEQSSPKRPHDLSTECWCKPTVEVVHRKMQTISA